MKNENILRHLSASFIKIVGYGVDKMVYIACKPTSLARDLETFLREGYRVERVCCCLLYTSPDGCLPVRCCSPDNRLGVHRHSSPRLP